MKEGTSAILLQSGLDENMVADSMECCCYLRNVEDLLSDGKTPYERRFGEPLCGPPIPCGSMGEYHPTSSNVEMRLYQIGNKVFAGIFVGYAWYAGESGKEMFWSQTLRS